MSDRANGLCVSEARDKTAIDNRKDSPFGLDRSVRRLIEDAPHLAVALRAAVTVVHARALLIAGAGSHPGGECLGDGNGAAVAPTSAMIYCAESAPSPGTSASRCTAS
jgi:hypothetical protein